LRVQSTWGGGREVARWQVLASPDDLSEFWLAEWPRSGK
jgi:hypothetical protein